MLPNSSQKKKRVDNQCYVISSTINRRNEFKTDQYPIVKNFRILLKKSLSKDQIESLWEEFYACSEDLSFYEQAYFKVYHKKKTIKEKEKEKKKNIQNTNVLKKT